MDNRYGSYRQVRAQRTWRTLGKMSWWRIILGTALLLSVFLISGFFSQRLALAGHFRAAQKLMVYPRWVEQYRPDLKAFIDAGLLYESGDYEAAREAFAGIDEQQAAAVMANTCAVKLAAEKLRDGDTEAGRALLDTVDPTLLQKDAAAEYTALLEELSPPGAAGS
ncbi:MAG: hypothetical protein Q4E38_07290 [Eubacteriales bacterium]|nr:hypothetical protein [Eubacteriales bacterium]